MSDFRLKTKFYVSAKYSMAYAKKELVTLSSYQLFVIILIDLFLSQMAYCANAAICYGLTARS